MHINARYYNEDQQGAREELVKDIVSLLDEGWKIVPTSCQCGGRWAWVKPNAGCEEMVGCVCHTTLQAIEQLQQYKQRERLVQSMLHTTPKREKV